MTAFVAFIRRVLRWRRPAPTPRRAERRPCPGCGRVVAHTLTGRPYVHRCRVELLGGGA